MKYKWQKIFLLNTLSNILRSPVFMLFCIILMLYISHFLTYYSNSSISLSIVHVPKDWIELIQSQKDALEVANNVGVLQVLSIALTIIAVLLTVFGFFGYITIRNALLAQAKETEFAIASQESKKIAEISTKSYFDDYIKGDDIKTKLQKATREIFEQYNLDISSIDKVTSENEKEEIENQKENFPHFAEKTEKYL